MKRNTVRVTRIRRSRAGNIAMALVLGVVAAFMSLPLIYAISNAFKPYDELFMFPPRFFVRNPTMENFVELFDIMEGSWVPFSRYLFNSVLVTAAGTLGHILLSSACAYSLSKIRFKGSDLVFSLIVLSLMFSSVVTTVPNYILMSKLHLIDTYWSIILPAFQSSLGLYLMKQFIDSVPDALLEAAKIDGASEFSVFIKIVMPLIKPAWLTLMILSVQNLWNTISPFIYSDEMKTLPHALSQIVAGGIARAGVGSAVAVLTMTVPVVCFVLSQSNIIETMGTSGMKE